jgi:hypothetical protein
MTTPQEELLIARIKLRTARLTLAASALSFLRFIGRVAIACWVGGFVFFPAEEIDSHAPKVVAVATAPARALGVDRG